MPPPGLTAPGRLGRSQQPIPLLCPPERNPVAIITNRIILHSQIRYEDRDARDGSPHPDDLDSATLLIIEIAYKPKSHPERVLRPYVGVGPARLQTRISHFSRKLANRGTNLGSNRLDYVQRYTALDVLNPYQHLNRPSSERSAKPELYFPLLYQNIFHENSPNCLIC